MHGEAGRSTQPAATDQDDELYQATNKKTFWVLRACIAGLQTGKIGRRVEDHNGSFVSRLGDGGAGAGKAAERHRIRADEPVQPDAAGEAFWNVGPGTAWSEAVHCRARKKRRVERHSGKNCSDGHGGTGKTGTTLEWNCPDSTTGRNERSAYYANPNYTNP